MIQVNKGKKAVGWKNSLVHVIPLQKTTYSVGRLNCKAAVAVRLSSEKLSRKINTCSRTSGHCTAVTREKKQVWEQQLPSGHPVCHQGSRRGCCTPVRSRTVVQRWPVWDVWLLLWWWTVLPRRTCWGFLSGYGRPLDPAEYSMEWWSFPPQPPLHPKGERDHIRSSDLSEMLSFQISFKSQWCSKSLLSAS